MAQKEQQWKKAGGKAGLKDAVSKTVTNTLVMNYKKSKKTPDDFYKVRTVIHGGGEMRDSHFPPMGVRIPHMASDGMPIKSNRSFDTGTSRCTWPLCIHYTNKTNKQITWFVPSSKS